MDLAALHREDVLAQIRKVHGSAAAFERSLCLPAKSVNEVLRGRANARVKRAIEALLAEHNESPDISGNTRKVGKVHRQKLERAA